MSSHPQLRLVDIMYVTRTLHFARNDHVLRMKFALLVPSFEEFDILSFQVETNSDAGKFIMKSYFEDYESLHDSSFEDFMAHQLSSSLCQGIPDNRNVGVRFSVRELSLVGEGSHRHLSSSIRLQIGAASIPKLPAHICDVIVIQRLPLGVFADPFELQNPHKHKGKPAIDFPYDTTQTF